MPFDSQFLTTNKSPEMSRNTPKQAAPEFRTMNADLFTLTYGALVMDVIKDREQVRIRFSIKEIDFLKIWSQIFAFKLS